MCDSYLLNFKRPRSSVGSAGDREKGKLFEGEAGLAGEKHLQVGDKAPDFTLPKANGELVSLSDFRGRADVVLFFYPKDNSPVCTAEACSFRDSYEVFRDAGAEVIGISTDSAESHERFAVRFRCPLYF